MMIRAAGGPGLVSPIDFGERKTKLNKNTWIAIGVVGLAHVGVAVAIYHQRFELTPGPEVADAPPIKGVVIDLPRPIEIKPTETVKPVPPNSPVHISPLPNLPVETFTATPGEVATTSNTVTFDRPVADPTPDVVVVEPQPPRPPAVITRPRWASQPSAAQMARAYPDRALSNGVAGSATMQCLVTAGGGLTNCAVMSETPRGQNFGRAASSLTRYFQMSPGMVDGQPIDGARVSFTVRFAVSE